jgi:hypothetical protein
MLKRKVVGIITNSELVRILLFAVEPTSPPTFIEIFLEDEL